MRLELCNVMKPPPACFSFLDAKAVARMRKIVADIAAKEQSKEDAGEDDDEDASMDSGPLRIEPNNTPAHLKQGNIFNASFVK